MLEFQELERENRVLKSEVRRVETMLRQSVSSLDRLSLMTKPSRPNHPEHNYGGFRYANNTQRQYWSAYANRGQYSRFGPSYPGRWGTHGVRYDYQNRFPGPVGSASVTRESSPEVQNEEMASQMNKAAKAAGLHKELQNYLKARKTDTGTSSKSAKV